MVVLRRVGFSAEEGAGNEAGVGRCAITSEIEKLFGAD